MALPACRLDLSRAVSSESVLHRSKAMVQKLTLREIALLQQAESEARLQIAPGEGDEAAGRLLDAERLCEKGLLRRLRTAAADARGEFVLTGAGICELRDWPARFRLVGSSDD